MVSAATRLRVLGVRSLRRMGLGGEGAFLLALAVAIGILAAAAAVGFHLAIVTVRDRLYLGAGPELYAGRLWLLILFPAAGGLAVGLLSRYVFRVREGHGIVDVLEAVIRWRGVIRPLSAVEKIVTSALTIGSGGSAGAEGPIVQIGAGIASGVGQLFRIARSQMPLLIGCGSAAGISSIFNSPLGGVFFTLEVVLLDFSIRAVAPVLLASVIANVTTQWLLARLHPHEPYAAIFALSPADVAAHAGLSWAGVVNFLLLGLLCGLVGVTLVRLMRAAERWFAGWRLPAVLRPAAGGAMVGMLGVLYVVVFGWWLLGVNKPIGFAHYPLPAFFSDGYGVVRQLVRASEAGIYHHYPAGLTAALLGGLLVAKLLATPATLASGGSGGIIAPSLFLGATTGALLGVVLRAVGATQDPHLYALVGMGAVLAAVVHAPLAAILILLDLTGDSKLILPAMLSAVAATGLARLIFPDSIYTMSLRARGVMVGSASDLSLLRRLTVEEVELEPATPVGMESGFAQVLELTERTGAASLVVTDPAGRYAGLVTADDIKAALMRPELSAFWVVADLVRTDVPAVEASHDLARTLDLFNTHDVERLPVCLSSGSGRVIGMISRASLMRRYQRALAERG